MGKKTRFLVKVGLVVTLIVVGLSGVCLAQVALDVEQWVLEQKWAEVRQALSADDLTSDPAAKWLSAYASLATGDYREATELFARFENPADIAKLVDYASALAQKNPGNAVAQMLRGEALARSGSYQEALATLDLAVRLDSRSTLVHDVRGVVRALAGKTEEAIADFEQAIGLEPTFANAHANLGLVQLAAGNAPGAVESLTQALELAPDFALAYNGRAVACSMMEGWSAAESDFAAANTLSSNQLLMMGNVKTLERMKAEAAFRKDRWMAKLEQRGTALIAQSTEYRVVDLGGDRTMDAFIIKPTEQTSTLTGARNVIRGIVADLRAANSLPGSWQPRIHIDAHGAFSTPSAQLDYAAQAAHESGADVVILLDLSSWYKSPKAMAWKWAVDEGAKFLGTINAAVNMEIKSAPTFTGFSGGAEIVPRLGELSDKGALPKEITDNLRFNNVVLAGYPFHNIKGGDVVVPDALLQRIEGRVYNLHTDPGQWSNRLQTNDRVANIRVRDLQGHAVAHSDWTHPVIKGRPNPVYELAGLSLRGTTPSAVQSLADQRSAGDVPIYSVSAKQPITMAVTMASMTERGLRTGDRVLIGSLDPERASAMRGTLGSRQTEIRAVTDPGRLQEMARKEGFSRILLITPGSPDYLSESLWKREQQRPFATLPDIRPFRETLSRSLQAVSVLEKVTNTKVLADSTKNSLKLSGAVAEDLITSQRGHFHPLTSQTLEELGKVGLGLLEKKVVGLSGIGDMVGSLASQVGRHADMPNLNEATRFLDGFNKSVWAMTGYVVSGGSPVAAKGFSEVADLTVYTMRGMTASLFEQEAMTQIHGPVINQYLTQLESARARGVLTPTFTDLFTPEEVRKMRLPEWRVNELNNLAWWHNQVIMNRTGGGAQSSPAASSDYLKIPVPTQRVEMRKKPDIIIYDGPGKWGGPPPPPPSPPAAYRLPSTAVPGDKRGGVKMKADVVKGEPADTSEMFGGGATEKPAVAIQQEGLYSPFLLFCAVPVTGK